MASERYAKFISRTLILLYSVACLLAASCGLEKKLFPTITPAEAEEVKKICSNIKTPTSFVKIEDNYAVKPNIAQQKYQYISADPPDDLDRYFVNQLTKTGWTYKRDRGVKSISLLFKKDKYAIAIVIAYSGYLSTPNNLHIVSCSIGIH